MGTAASKWEDLDIIFEDDDEGRPYLANSTYYLDLDIEQIADVVQRIPSYDKYLNDLLEDTEESHPDYDDLSKAATRVRSMVREREEEMEHLENEHKVESVQHRFPNDDLQLVGAVDNAKKKVTTGVSNRRRSSPGAVLLKTLGKKPPSFLNIQNLPLLPDTSNASKTSGAPGSRRYILEGPVQLTAGLQTQDRYFFLFSDLLLIGKQRSSTTFKLKHRVRVCEMWTASCLDEVSEATRSLDSSFVMGWPTTNVVATFNSPETKELWLTRLKEHIEAEKEKEQPRKLVVKIFNKDMEEYPSSKCLTIGNDDDAQSVIKRCLAEFNIQTGEAKDYQLWVVSSKEDSPYPLIGHEQPYSIQMSHVRDVTKGYADDDVFTMDEEKTDTTHCQFVFREAKKAPAKLSLDEGSKRKKLKMSHIINRFKKRDSKSDTSPSLSSSRQGKLFGHHLTDLYEQCESQIPKPIMGLLHMLFVHGPYTTGIFRKSANHKTCREVRERLDSGVEDLGFEENDMSVVISGALLKEFLRNMSDCLFLCDLYDDWLDTVDIEDPEIRAETVRRLVSKLPVCHQELLQYLMCVLHHISRRSEENSMNAYNLAVCIGQSLVWPHMGSSTGVRVDAVEKVPVFVQYLIENCQEVLGKNCVRLFGEPVVPKPRQDSASTDSDSMHSMLSLPEQNGYGRRDDSSIDSLERDLYGSEMDSSPCLGKSHLSPTNLSRDSGLTLSDTQLYNDEPMDVESNSPAVNIRQPLMRSSSQMVDMKPSADPGPLSNSYDGTMMSGGGLPVPPPRKHRGRQDYGRNSRGGLLGLSHSASSQTVGEMRKEMRRNHFSKRVSNDSLGSLDEYSEIISGEGSPSDLQELQNRHRCRDIGLLTKSESGARLYISDEINTPTEEYKDYPSSPRSERTQSVGSENVTNKSSNQDINDSVHCKAGHLQPASRKHASCQQQPQTYHSLPRLKKSSLSMDNSQESGYGSSLSSSSRDEGWMEYARRMGALEFCASYSHLEDRSPEQDNDIQVKLMSSSYNDLPTTKTSFIVGDAENEGVEHMDVDSVSKHKSKKSVKNIEDGAKTKPKLLIRVPPYSGAGPVHHRPPSSPNVPRNKENADSPRLKKHTPLLGEIGRSSTMPDNPDVVMRKKKVGMTSQGKDFYPGSMITQRLYRRSLQEDDLLDCENTMQNIKPSIVKPQISNSEPKISDSQQRKKILDSNKCVSHSHPPPPSSQIVDTPTSSGDNKPHPVRILHRQLQLEKSASDSKLPQKFLQQHPHFHSRENTPTRCRPDKPPSYQEAIRRKSLLKSGLLGGITEQDIIKQTMNSAKARQLYEQSLQLYSEEGPEQNPVQPPKQVLEVPVPVEAPAQVKTENQCDMSHQNQSQSHPQARPPPYERAVIRAEHLREIKDQYRSDVGQPPPYQCRKASGSSHSNTPSPSRAGLAISNDKSQLCDRHRERAQHKRESEEQQKRSSQQQQSQNPESSAHHVHKRTPSPSHGEVNVSDLTMCEKHKEAVEHPTRGREEKSAGHHSKITDGTHSARRERRRPRDRSSEHRLSDTRLQRDSESRRHRVSNLSRSKSDSSEHINRINKRAADDDKENMGLKALRIAGQGNSVEDIVKRSSSDVQRRARSYTPEMVRSGNSQIADRALQDRSHSDEQINPEEPKLRRKSLTGSSMKHTDWHRQLSDQYSQTFYQSPSVENIVQYSYANKDEHIHKGDKPRRKWSPPTHPTKDLIIKYGKEHGLIRSASACKDINAYRSSSAEKTVKPVNSDRERRSGSAPSRRQEMSVHKGEEKRRESAGVGRQLGNQPNLPKRIILKDSDKQTPSSGVKQRGQHKQDVDGSTKTRKSGLNWSVAKLRNVYGQDSDSSSDNVNSTRTVSRGHNGHERTNPNAEEAYL